jgi:putative transposase
MDEQLARVAERGLLLVSDEVWELAGRRAAVIGRLAVMDAVGLAAADVAAAELGVSRRLVYVLLARWREGEGVVSDLIPGRSSGGRGRQELPDEVEAVIGDVLRSRFLTRQKRSVSAVHREIVRVCRSRGLSVPSRGSLQRRIAKLDPIKAASAREGLDATRALRSAGGEAPAADAVLAQVQIDHTVVDLIVVDERHRLPIGRPYVTLAIDVFSRCIVGLVVTLEAPSGLSVGLCLAHAVIDKRAWLERVGVEASWVMGGKPRELYVDNAAEFKSEALRRGCEQHGINLRWRPPGQPHYGGIIERVIGTMMQSVHELPGTTFSDPRARAGYDSDARAVLTIGELERWLALAVCSYHGQLHAGLVGTPAGRWAEGVAATGSPGTVANETAFLVDFLPVIRRSLARSGFVIDHVRYYSDGLKPWIARRRALERFVIRRDPRDISRIWVLDPAGESYLQVPYRTLSHPPISLWEHRAAVAQLREQGRAQVDEQALFAMVEQMRTITDTAAKTTRRARRNTERRTSTPARAAQAPLPPACPEAGVRTAAEPFAVIEQW